MASTKDEAVSLREEFNNSSARTVGIGVTEVKQSLGYDKSRPVGAAFLVQDRQVLPVDVILEVFHLTGAERKAAA